MPNKYETPIDTEEKILNSKKISKTKINDDDLFEVKNEKTSTVSVYPWWQIRHMFNAKTELAIIKNLNKEVKVSYLTIRKKI